jgi:hypothetical protein
MKKLAAVAAFLFSASPAFAEDAFDFGVVAEPQPHMMHAILPMGTEFVVDPAEPVAGSEEHAFSGTVAEDVVVGGTVVFARGARVSGTVTWNDEAGIVEIDTIQPPADRPEAEAVAVGLSATFAAADDDAPFKVRTAQPVPVRVAARRFPGATMSFASIAP